MYSLVDCNNFYASCERLFRPDLQQKPLVVLSNNDGCVIARSNEAKELGIKMGIPYFKVKALCREKGVQAFSSNYTLYGDLSNRVIRVIKENWDAVEIYSIDEAFLDLTTLSPSQGEDFCIQLQEKIKHYTGIPTSVGIGKTKTLAKIANLVAKKLKIPVFLLDSSEFWLKKIPIEEVWGVGRQWKQKLNHLGIVTAWDLAHFDSMLLRKQFNIVLQRTAMELAGITCLALKAPEKKQSIMSSCSFGALQTEFNDIQQAISHHCGTAWAKMRKQGLIAKHLSVFLYTNRFRKDLPFYSNSVGFQLINPTDDVRVLSKWAQFCLKKIFKPGFHYYKSGILLSDLVEKNYQQLDLFNQSTDNTLQEADTLMNLIDTINAKYGARTVRLAAEGFQKPWAMKKQLKSPNYTTQWHELPVVYAK